MAGESVAISVEAATALAFWGFGTCGMVGTLDQVGLVAGHISFPFAHKKGPAVGSGPWEAFAFLYIGYSMSGAD